MAHSAMNITWEHLDAAELWRLSEDMVLNQLEHNVSDFISSTLHGDNALILVDAIDPDCGGDTAMKLHRVTSNSDVINFHGGGSAAIGDVFVGTFRAKASAATNVDAILKNTYGGGTTLDTEAIALTTEWRTYTLRFVVAVSPAKSVYLRIDVAAGVTDVWLKDVHLWKRESYDDLPRFQQCTIGAKVSMDVKPTVDQTFDRSRNITEGVTSVAFIDPYIDNDPAWWLDKMNARGREWNPGLQYFDGDFVEDATTYWTSQSATIAWTATDSVIGSKSLEVTMESSTSVDPYASRIQTLTCASRRFEASVWVTVRPGSDPWVATAPMTIYDGTTDHGSTIYTLSSAYPALVREVFTAGKAATYLQARLHGPDTTTESARYDGFKIEPLDYTPFPPQKASNLTALYLRFTDITYYYHVLVPRLRYAVNQQQMKISSYFYDAIRATGDRMLRWRETR